MIRYLVRKAFTSDLEYIEAAGLPDEKPTEGIISGSRFTDVTSGNEYIFDEENKKWNPKNGMEEVEA